MQTYEDLLKSSLDQGTDRLTVDDEDENISVTRTDSTIRSRSSSRSPSWSGSRMAETPRAYSDRALNLDTKCKPSDSSSSIACDRDDADSCAFDDSASVVRISGGRASTSRSGRSQTKKSFRVAEDTQDQGLARSSPTPVPAEEPIGYEGLVVAASSRKKRRASPAPDVEDLRASQKSPEREDLTDDKDKEEPRIPYALPMTTFDRLELLKKPNGLAFPMYKYSGVEATNFTLPLLLPGLEAVNRSLYSTHFAAQHQPGGLYPAVSGESPTVPMFHTHYTHALGSYQPPQLQLPPVDFYRKEQLQQVLGEPKEPLDGRNARATPAKGAFFYASAVESSLSAQQASIATIH